MKSANNLIFEHLLSFSPRPALVRQSCGIFCWSCEPHRATNRSCDVIHIVLQPSSTL